jgi:hypothetical protein
LMICLRTLLRIYKNSPTKKILKNKIKLVAQAALSSQGFCFWGITPKPKIKIL